MNGSNLENMHDQPKWLVVDPVEIAYFKLVFIFICWLSLVNLIFFKKKENIEEYNFINIKIKPHNGKGTSTGPINSEYIIRYITREWCYGLLNNVLWVMYKNYLLEEY
jgi:hypothetical protein